MTFLSDVFTHSKNKARLVLSALLPIAVLAAAMGLMRFRTQPVAPTKVIATIPAAIHLSFTPQEFAADLDVARVFGRSAGCADADSKLITAVASEALTAGIEPKLLAATVAVESTCDPMAVSKRGAIGLTQVMPRIWKDKFDFTAINLFNPHENLHTGALIEAGLVKQYGITDGIRRYQGVETGCASCDDNYVPKILALAGRR